MVEGNGYLKLGNSVVQKAQILNEKIYSVLSTATGRRKVVRQRCRAASYHRCPAASR